MIDFLILVKYWTQQQTAGFKQAENEMVTRAPKKYENSHKAEIIK